MSSESKLFFTIDFPIADNTCWKLSRILVIIFIKSPFISYVCWVPSPLCQKLCEALYLEMNKVNLKMTSKMYKPELLLPRSLEAIEGDL